MQGRKDETTGIGFVSFKNQVMAGVSRNTYAHGFFSRPYLRSMEAVWVVGIEEFELIVSGIQRSFC
jgi:hypothetical protein